MFIIPSEAASLLPPSILYLSRHPSPLPMSACLSGLDFPILISCEGCSPSFWVIKMRRERLKGGRGEEVWNEEAQSLKGSVVRDDKEEGCICSYVLSWGNDGWLLSYSWPKLVTVITAANQQARTYVFFLIFFCLFSQSNSSLSSLLCLKWYSLNFLILD